MVCRRRRKHVFYLHYIYGTELEVFLSESEQNGNSGRITHNEGKYALFYVETYSDVKNILKLRC